MRAMRSHAVLVLLVAITAHALPPVASAQDPAPVPATPDAAPRPELGRVAWRRDFDPALAAAKQAEKPVFLLFQEIPGCATCTGFGRDVLSHPLLREAIEDCFVPVVVRNNVDGEERRIRERYEEPAWNNPVVRFVDGEGEDLLPRADGIWDAHGIARRMVQALEKAKRPVPGYLALALAETDPDTKTAVFRMHCFWEGEAALGALDGVVRTRAAFRSGAEVVEVTYRPAAITLAQLTERAQAKSCQPVGADGVSLAKHDDQQHALGGTPFAKLELSPIQRTKVHASLTAGRDAKVWLTPRQLAALNALEAPPPAKR